MKKICRICFVMLGVIIAGSLLVKFIFKDDLRNLVKVHWCRQMIQNQELLEEHANALIHQKRGEITEKANKKITETINKKLGKTYIWCALFEDHAIDGNGAAVVYEKSLASVGFGMIMLIIADFITMIMKNRWKCMIHITIFRGIWRL